MLRSEQYNLYGRRKQNSPSAVAVASMGAVVSVMLVKDTGVEESK